MEILGFGTVLVLASVLLVRSLDDTAAGTARTLAFATWMVGGLTGLVYFIRWSGPLDALVPGWLFENLGWVAMSVLLVMRATLRPPP